MRRTRIFEPVHVWDLLVASDPTLSRLRTGLRAVVGAALSAWALSSVARVVVIPPTVWLLGVELAMASAVFVPEGPLAVQRRAALLAPLAAVSAAALAALASAVPPLAATALALAVIFGAVWARRYGPAGVGVGMAAFLTFFVSLYFGIRPAQWPAAAASLAAGGVIAAVTRFVLVRERPERAGPRTFAALHRVLAIVLRRLEDELFARPGPRLSRRLVGLIDRVHEIALAADDLLARAPTPPRPLGTGGDEDRDAVFGVQLATERVIQAVEQAVVSGALPRDARQAIRDALEAARQAARGRGIEGAVARSLGSAKQRVVAAGAPARAMDDLRRLRTSLGDLTVAARRIREVKPPAIAVPAAPAPATGRGPLGLQPATRQAIQATLASAIAMAAGVRLSSTRWFWAVTAAFVVFSRATTVADTVQRAWLRVLGTLLGAGAGMLLGAAVTGHPRLQLVAVFACIFLAYWLFRLNYAWLLFWFTALISVLYRILGRFTPQLMVLRIEETLVGAGVGAVVAALVLPIHARGRVRSGTADVLRATADWLGHAVVERAPSGGGAARLDASRAMEDRLRALRATAQPLLGNPVRSRSARLVHGATSVVLYARHLAPGAALAHLDAEGRAAVVEAGRRLAALARRIGAMLEDEEAAVGEAPLSAREPLARARASLRGPAAVPNGPATPPVWLHWLERLDEALEELALAVEPGRVGSGKDASTAGIANGGLPDPE